jgi:hypothetical protein
MKYVTPIGVPKEEGGGKMVFLVIVCIDSYLYTRKKNAHASLWGGGGQAKPRIKKWHSIQ